MSLNSTSLDTDNSGVKRSFNFSIPKDAFDQFDSDIIAGELPCFTYKEYNATNISRKRPFPEFEPSYILRKLPKPITAHMAKRAKFLPRWKESDDTSSDLIGYYNWVFEKICKDSFSDESSNKDRDKSSDKNNDKFSQEYFKNYKMYIDNSSNKFSENDSDKFNNNLNDEFSDKSTDMNTERINYKYTQNFSDMARNNECNSLPIVVDKLHPISSNQPPTPMTCLQPNPQYLTVKHNSSQIKHHKAFGLDRNNSNAKKSVALSRTKKAVESSNQPPTPTTWLQSNAQFLAVKQNSQKSQIKRHKAFGLDRNNSNAKKSVTPSRTKKAVGSTKKCRKSKVCSKTNSKYCTCLNKSVKNSSKKARKLKNCASKKLKYYTRKDKFTKSSRMKTRKSSNNTKLSNKVKRRVKFSSTKKGSDSSKKPPKVKRRSQKCSKYCTCKHNSSNKNETKSGKSVKSTEPDSSNSSVKSSVSFSDIVEEFDSVCKNPCTVPCFACKHNGSALTCTRPRARPSPSILRRSTI